ncbi:hypothetical protein A3G55_00420 [Candidatus Giovannonibacteria bacterium RIFCSPLOWO2_12_FULL_44_25]|uniref:BioF2-like acetyltransferase domain-containing protein n=2 Tax=Candidatus Giovannoniibacteriota TaxID=1752738 RepID=A0A1F5WAI0_9BACT|nr:MAG: hypothetical protein UW15_C0012G0020 [Parcubacteria group bacterium GW2011_GWC1_44_10]KKT60398.1 MAG: hypothetical protein UW53_C0001G0048 [Candidatus Giovannonibacteria bacterium GW2011_GWA1_44_25]KKU30256.1 MAG: hypothetical protein UX43_C0001G0028 [Candidatus Giovannonibacteria bacterium GW2011_GWB1_46_20]OGF50464.1 MAG: hypothetical protein A2120_02355 [Candidatus Giovannonibacteria bacterium GWA2_45_15]OGF59597.1 MAG: hypothetical protein A2W40_04250 [Candidatus Giovannonibacteria 
MEPKIIYYKDVDPAVWDGWVQKVGGSASYYHTWHWINYISQFPEVRENASFVLLDKNKEPVAVCPMALSFFDKENIAAISFGHSPCGAPALCDISAGTYRDTLDKILDIYQSYGNVHNARQISFGWHPLNSLAMSGAGRLANENSFGLLRYGLHYYVENTLVTDLSLSEEALADNLGKYHYRHIKRGAKRGIAIRVFNSKNNFAETPEQFRQFQGAHLAAAGRQTRPQATWDAMLDGIRAGHASLFIAFLRDTPISYLYCGEFFLMAFGWSQANVEKYEKEYSPRHLLEWEAMLFYKKNGFKFYEIGERFYGPQPFYIPTAKEISIGIFKERYGGMLLPKIKWVGYFDREYMEKQIQENSKKFLAESPLFKIPENA